MEIEYRFDANRLSIGQIADMDRSLKEGLEFYQLTYLMTSLMVTMAFNTKLNRYYLPQEVTRWFISMPVDDYAAEVDRFGETCKDQIQSAEWRAFFGLGFTGEGNSEKE